MRLTSAGERKLPGLVIRHEPTDIDFKGCAGCAERDVADELLPDQLSDVGKGAGVETGGLPESLKRY